jgi:transcriptional regulator PpsR
MTPSTGNAEITLRIDADGVISDAAFGVALESESSDAWVGKLWTDIVSEATRPKVQRLIDDARSTGVSGFRQVNHFLPSGAEIPVEYSAVQVTADGSLIAVGRSLLLVSELQQRLVRAQQALERDHWRLREIETRYRLLFHRSPEAILVLEPETLRVVDANPAAEQLFGIAEGQAADSGISFGSAVVQADRFRSESQLRRAVDTGRSEPFSLRLRGHEEPLECRAALMSGGSDGLMLVHLRSGRGAADEPIRRGVDFGDLFERIPDAMVILDGDGNVALANQRFLSLVQLRSPEEARGAHLSRWLGRPGADLTILQALVRRHGSVNLFSTRMLGEFGSATEVEIAAVPVDPGAGGMALLIRDVGRRISEGNGIPKDLGGALEGLSRELGRSSLKSLVRRTVELVERRLVSDALEMTEGNRTAAAELLGLSRQGLYTKLARYGIDAPDGE